MRKDPLAGFDIDTLLKHGVKSWTFTDIEVSSESLADMDDKTAEYLAREILRLSKPELFADYDAAEAQKNDSASSGDA